MQAKGEVVRTTGGRAAPPDFHTFFEDEHRRSVQDAVLRHRRPGGGRRPDAGGVPEALGTLGPDRTIEDPRAYLFRVALNGSKMRARAADPSLARRAVPLGVVRDPYDDVDIREDVRRMLLTLTPRQRAALVLLDLYGYGSEDAGRIMGIRPSTVRALATQGRAVLREQEAPMTELKELSRW